MTYQSEKSRFGKGKQGLPPPQREVGRRIRCLRNSQFPTPDKKLGVGEVNASGIISYFWRQLNLGAVPV